MGRQHIIGDDEDTPLVRFRSVKYLQFSSEFPAENRSPVPAQWILRFGTQLLQVEANDVYIYWSGIDDAIHALWNMATEMRTSEQENARFGTSMIP